MVKVSVTLPNNAQVTVEAEESEVARGVVGIVLRELPRDLMLSPQQSNGDAPPPAAQVGGNSVVAAVSHQPSAISSQLSAKHFPPEGGRELTADRLKAESSRAFTHFCQAANPLGDMRRVVVAAEGAKRFLDQAEVDAETLGQLFDLAGWRRPHSFTQTLRNAGRSTFRWLERVPGRAGRYTLTDAGRAAVLAE
jgi:hypothetical protein